MSTCPYCQCEVDENAFACSNCGRAIASPHNIGQSLGDLETSSIHAQLEHKRNKLSLWGLILGGVSFPSSLLFLSLLIDANISGSASDFQGVLCIPLFSLAMAPVGFVSVIFGILGLVDLSKNKIEYGKGFAIAGIILGLPGSYLTLHFLYILLTTSQ